MLFYRHNLEERSPTRYCNGLQEVIQQNEHTPLHRLKGKYCHVQVSKFYNPSTRKLIYFLHTGSDVIGFAELERPRGWVAFEVTYLFVRPDSRKMGAALSLYDTIINDRILLMSGWSQNPKSRGLWMKLIKQDKYNIWAQDILDMEKSSQVYFDDEGNLQTNLKLYQDVNKRPKKLRSDVRLLVMKCKSARCAIDV